MLLLLNILFKTVLKKTQPFVFFANSQEQIKLRQSPLPGKAYTFFH